MKKLWHKTALSALLFLTLCLPQAVQAAQSTSDAADYYDIGIIHEVLQYLSDNNIEGVQQDEFIENAIRGMVYTLDDPYSDYFTEEELQGFEDELNQEYVGIGVLIRYANDNLYITEVLDSSPAQSAGLRKGDIMTKINGNKVSSPEDIFLIQGPENTKVSITVKRGSSQLTYQVTRAHFSLPAVTSRLISSGDIGYIAVSTFSDQADEEFAVHMSKLRKLGMKALVLDLRDNLGGYVESAHNIAKQFIKDGVLMYTESQGGELEEIKITGGNSIGIPGR